MATRIPSEDEKRIHTKLLNDLSDHFDAVVNKKEFEQFLNSCRALDVKPIVIKEAINALSVFQSLEKKGKIRIGNYDALKKIINEFNVPLLAVIEKAERDIDNIKPKSAVQSPEEETHSDSHPPSSRKRNLNVPATITGGQSGSSTGIPDSPQPPKRGRGVQGNESDDSTYQYKSDGKKGLLVILNFTHRRAGTLEDERRLKEFFKDNLHWEVETRQDLTYDKVDRYLGGLQERLCNSETADKYYCLVVTVMSHGNKEGIYPHDSMNEKEEKQTYPYDRIFSFFKNDEINTFADKPKVFLVQACRGKQTQGEVVPDDDPMEVEPQGTTIPPASVRISIPVDAELLIMWATTPGFLSFRDQSSGSHFLQEVVSQFQDNYRSDSVETMLMKVRYTFAHTNKYRMPRLLRDKDGSMVRETSVQMPCTWTTLTKSLYLE